MKNIKQFFSLIAVLFAAFATISVANATPESLPAGAKAVCIANQDGTGTLTITGVEVKRVELYTHAPTSEKKLLNPAPNYGIPPNTTFNFVFKNAAGEDRYVLVGGESPQQVAKVFNATATNDGQFQGITVVPDAKHGGIGYGGASMGCTHMLRAKKS